MARNLKSRRLAGAILILTMLTLAACDAGDPRLAELAERNTREQARQNERMAEQNRAIAEGSRELVEADSQARRELLAAQQDLQDQQRSVAQGLDALETERRAIATQRHRDPIIAAAITTVGLLLACLLPLGLCWYVLRSLHAGGTGEALGELLVMEFASEAPLLLPPSPEQPLVGLPGSGQSPRDRTDEPSQSKNG